VVALPSTFEFDSYQRQIDVLNRLVKISLVMNSTFTLEPLLQFIIESAAEITCAQSASILLVDDNIHALRFAAAKDPDPDRLAGIVVPVEDSIAGAILIEDRAIITDDVSRDPRHYREVDRRTSFHTHSLLGVPLRIKNKRIGVLEVLNKYQGRFNDDDVQHITILASQAAVAIENAQLVAALREAYDDLARLDQLKSNFISIASHELKTPLGVILGYATFLKEDSQGESGEHAQMVLDSAQHLRNLIEGMTNLTYVDLDTSEFSVTMTPVADILDFALADCRRLAEAKRQMVAVEGPAVPVEVMVDPQKAAMALTNVLNNAVKFTPAEGTIAVCVTAHERKSEVWIRVSDNGVGIADDQLGRVFDQFYQVEDPMTRQHDGLGLGLAIARSLLERQNGRIWAESAGLGHGTTFTLALPLAASESPG
jgi:signal transduction histidine kinase